MLWEQRVRYAALTDIGFRRKNNQDSCAVALCQTKEEWEEGGHLFVVADGMCVAAAVRPLPQGELTDQILVKYW